MSKAEAKIGEIWTIGPVSTQDGLSYLVLLIESVGQSYLGLPLFDNALLASSQDICLSDDTDWLNGQRWCAALDGCEVARERLRRRITQVPEDLLNEIQAFRRGEGCRLRRGKTFFPQLDDPRTAHRELMLGDVQRCATAPVEALVATVIRVSRTAMGNIGVAIRRAGEDVFSQLSDRHLGVAHLICTHMPLWRTFRGVLRSVFGQTGLYVFFDTGPYFTQLRIRDVSGKWELGLIPQASGGQDFVAHSVPVAVFERPMAIWDSLYAQTSVRLETDTGPVPLARQGDEWVLERGPLAPGRYRLCITGPSGAAVAEVELP